MTENGSNTSALFLDYEATPDSPFGRLHPDAPPEVAHFGFMVGSFDCVEERLLPDGAYASRSTRWEASYILNGHAIQDKYWGPTMAATSIRFYDTNQDLWLVNYQAKPGNLFGYVWEGGQEGDQMVLTTTYPNAVGDTILSRLTYYDITEDGFEWLSEEINQRTGEEIIDWRISARRRS